MNKPTPIDKLLRNRGYCSRRDVGTFLANSMVTEGATRITHGATLVDPDLLTIDGAPLDPGSPLLVALHKPLGYVCSTVPDGGPTVFELLPERLQRREPTLACVGRLDKESSGLLLFTDDGDLLHRLTSPKHSMPKTYRVTLARPLRGDEAEILAAGTLILRSEEKPILPAELRVHSPTECDIIVTEGRYHLVRRIFAALGNHVEELRRVAIGRLQLGARPAGTWSFVSKDEL